MSSSKEIYYLTDELKVHCLQTEENPPQNNEFTLVTKIITQKSNNLNAFKNSILRSWNPSGKVLTNPLQNNTMAFIFNKEEDINKILNATWTFRDQQIAIARWPPDKSITEVNLNKILFWVHVFGIPVCYANLTTAQAIGGMIGTFVKSDINLATQKWKRSIRIQVELDINKPLISSMVLYCNSRSRFLTEIRYERLTDFCFKCGLLGHKIISCENPMTEIPKSIADNVFGPWMKVENTHIMNPKFHHLEDYPDQRNPNLNSSCSGQSTPGRGSPQYLGNSDESPDGRNFGKAKEASISVAQDSDHEMTGEGVEEISTAEIEKSKGNPLVNISGHSLQSQKQKDVEEIPQKEFPSSDTISIVGLYHKNGEDTVNPKPLFQEESSFAETKDLLQTEKIEISPIALNDIIATGPMDITNVWASPDLGQSLKRKFESPTLSEIDPLSKDSSSSRSDYLSDTTLKSPISPNPNNPQAKKLKLEPERKQIAPTPTYSIHRNTDGSPKLHKNRDISKVSSFQTNCSDPEKGSRE
ncbi:hypothetical protein CASFOL_005667 [Castilleja foliolosa]|uniref:CCHC-type domain-containing protein n=1 Tax=Castilleja foliolosa TaxID=1961234 RepID=A0ABD3E840_9LAMI